jgi:hypothetical protein
MKGQAINIDWTIGLSLFLFTSLSAIFVTGFTDFGNAESLENIASETHEELENNAAASSVRNNLTAQTPEEINRIPVDRKFYTEGIVDWTADNPIYINSSENRFVSVIDSNETFKITYFTENTTFKEYYSDIETSNNWLNNSEIKMKVESSGIDQIRYSDKKFFDSISLTGNTDTRTEDIFAESFSGNLTLYNNSNEIIIREEKLSLTAGDYSEIYWHPEGEETLNDGYSEEKETQGFSIANSSQGITFTGDMDARVEKTGSNTQIEINSSKLRIRVHEEGTGYGEKRVKNYANGEIFLGLEQNIELLSRNRIDELENMTEEEFQEEIGLEDIGYDIEITGDENYLSKGESVPPLTDAVVINRNSQLISGNGETDNIEISVGVWR